MKYEETVASYFLHEDGIDNTISGLRE